MNLSLPGIVEVIPALEQSTDVCYALSASGELFYCNPAWDRFAGENDGYSCLSLLMFGKNFWNAVPPEMEPYFRSGFQTAVAEGVWEHEFECPSPTESRRYRMRVLPLEGGGFLVRNSLIEAAPILDQPMNLSRFRDQHGMYHLCSHCRRARVRASAEWLFAPELLRAGAYTISHGLCPICIRYYYSRELKMASSSH
jgi:hypothetical protein